MNYKKHNLKPIICLTLSIILIVKSITQTLAFAGYTHYYICSKASCHDKMINCNDFEKLAYKSAAIIADIGRLNWDTKYPDSDSYEFKECMIKIANDNNLDIQKYIALGWSDHVTQDKLCMKYINNIIPNKGSYYIKCGQIDNYARSCTSFLSKRKLFIDYDLIRDTYNELGNFSPPNHIIDKEISKCLYSSFFLSLFTFWGLNKSQVFIAENELSKLSNLCGSGNSDYDVLFN